MKLFKRCLLALSVMCVALLARPDTAEAEILENARSYTIDLDGNGEKEKVKCVGKETGEYNGYAVTIYINGKKSASISDKNAIDCSIAVVDINDTDPYEELYVHFISESGGFEKGCGYRYKNGKLEKLFTLSAEDAGSHRLFIMEKQPGDGLVYFESEFADAYTMQGQLKDAYKISSGKLKLVKKSVVSTTSEWRKKKYRASMSLQAYSSIGAKSAAFTIFKGDIFYIYKVRLKMPGKNWDGVTHIYVKTADGKKGWVKNPQKNYCEGYSEYDGWSMGAYAWG